MYCCGDSYVVRVYRRDETDPRRFIGLVEMVGRDEMKPFSSIEELWTILGVTEKHVKEKMQKRQKGA